MNQSNLQHLDNFDAKLVLKGVFFELSPITIPLCLIVTIQNTVIFISYFKGRKKLIPSLFMGIALGDILKAQGQPLLSLVSILVYKQQISEKVLYNNCSMLFNLVLTITLTIKVVNPFHMVNTARVRMIVLGLSVLISLCHLSFYCSYYRL